MGVATLFGAAFLGAILYLTQFNQQVFGATPTQSGLMLLPMIAGLMITSITSGQIISKTGKYKIFMQIGIVVATVMVGLLSTLSPQSSFAYEAVLMFFLGAGLGVVMPVMNLAVQNEFEQSELGAATSSNQLFRSLGSTIGIAVFGAMLTAGLTSGLANIQSDPYVKVISQSPEVKKIGDLTDPNTLLNLNAPDIKTEIKDGFSSSVSTLPTVYKDQATTQFNKEQSDYSNKIIDSFSNSLQRIFIVSASLMFLAAILVFAVKEKPLRAANPQMSPGLE
jgi:hypothetical protein